MLCVPLFSAGEVIGVLKVYADRRDAFGQGDEIVLGQLSEAPHPRPLSARSDAGGRSKFRAPERRRRPPAGICDSRSSPERQVRVVGCDYRATDRSWLPDICPTVSVAFLVRPPNDHRTARRNA